MFSFAPLSLRNYKNARSINPDPTYNSGIDVSHLATPHITIPNALDETFEKATLNIGNEDSEQHSYLPHHRQTQTPSSCAISTNQLHPFDSISSVTREADDDGPLGSSVHPRSLSEHSSSHQQRNSNESQSSPSNSSQMNGYNGVSRSRNRSTPDLPPLNQLQQQHQHHQMQQQHHHGQSHQDLQHSSSSQNQPLPPPRDHNNLSDTAATKLSYDIISVREPLAKILAERQQLLHVQQQHQQRQLIGDHEYIEVYGERGSSCFYEEIAGSVASSATYDQIGAVSNHNYQALINAYAVASARNNANRSDDNDNNQETGERHSNYQSQNEHQNHTYDVTSPSDQVDGPVQQAHQSTDLNIINEPQLSQSVAIYSVINKANKRNSSGLRNLIGNNTDERPPRPPPKNLRNYAPNMSIAQPRNQQVPTSKDSPIPSPSHSWSQANPIPSTSSYIANSNIITQASNTSDAHQDSTLLMDVSSSRLPQPPPRLHRNPNVFKASDRPLPSPNSIALSINNNNNRSTVDRNLAMALGDDDSESINNGYELLRSNLEDDQIDVGYEKIRESNRYSGGSFSSPFCALQLVDNGGYESVQPIYSSPSMAEPNYEAIASATASELAAAATAKLNAAATVIEHSNSQIGQTMI